MKRNAFHTTYIKLRLNLTVVSTTITIMSDIQPTSYMGAVSVGPSSHPIATPSILNDDQTSYYADHQAILHMNQWVTEKVKNRHRDESSKHYYTDAETQLLDTQEPELNDLFASLRTEYRDMGFFANDDYEGFLSVFLSNIFLRRIRTKKTNHTSANRETKTMPSSMSAIYTPKQNDHNASTRTEEWDGIMNTLKIASSHPPQPPPPPPPSSTSSSDTDEEN
jgi:hypothetical protein